MISWFVVNAHAQNEEKALFHLRRQGFHAYLPRYLKQRRHARKVDWVKAPMFPRYLFVRLDPESDQWRAIHSTVGVSRLVCYGDKPAPVPEGVVEDIQSREGEDGLVSIGLQNELKPGEKIRILHGPMADREGVFDCLDDQRRVFVLLDLLGRQVKVRLAHESVEACG